jgi:tetratricopeptide (TPR) repeat protein
MTVSIPSIISRYAITAAFVLLPTVATAQAARTRVLVMPFESGREPRAYWLGEASAVLLAEQLAALGGDAIGRDERVWAFERLQVPSVASLTHGTVIRIGQLVGASVVVVGSVHIENERLVVRARSMRLDAGRLQNAVEERASPDDLFGLYQRVARRIAPASSRPGAAALPPPPPHTAPPLAAFENYIKGLLAETSAAQRTFLRKAIELFPAYDAARLALWRAHTDAGEPEQALQTAITVAPTSRLNRQAQFAAALSEMQLKRYDEAFRRLRALGEAAPAAQIYNNLGIVQLRRGASSESGKATYWFNKATTTDPTDEDYFFNLGYAYWLEQDAPAATYWLREAVRRVPADADAHYVLASVLKSSGSVAEAERELELARRLSAEYESDPARNTGVSDKARGLERVKMTLEPVGTRIDTVLVASAQREQRELAGFHLERGRRLFEREQDSEAIAELRRTLYLAPYQAEAHLLLGRIYLRGGRTAEAIDAFHISLWSAESSEAHAALAEAYLKGRDSEAARREAARALELDPDAADARRVLEQLQQPR